MPLQTMDRRSIVAAFFIGALAMLVVILMEVSVAGRPSSIVWQQQQAYYLGIPAIGLLILARDVLHRAIWALIALASMALFLWSAALGAWQSGVALSLWGEPVICTASGTEVDLSIVGQVADGSAPSCGTGIMSILGMPLPILNAILASWIACLLGAALVRRVSGGLPVVQ